MSSRNSRFTFAIVAAAFVPAIMGLATPALAAITLDTAHSYLSAGVPSDGGGSTQSQQWPLPTNVPLTFEPSTSASYTDPMDPTGTTTRTVSADERLIASNARIRLDSTFSTLGSPYLSGAAAYTQADLFFTVDVPTAYALWGGYSVPSASGEYHVDLFQGFGPLVGGAAIGYTYAYGCVFGPDQPVPDAAGFSDGLLGILSPGTVYELRVVTTDPQADYLGGQVWGWVGASAAELDLTPVPEPGSLAVLALGACCWLTRRR